VAVCLYSFVAVYPTSRSQEPFAVRHREERSDAAVCLHTPVTTHPTLQSLRDPLPLSLMISSFKRIGKGSWQSAFTLLSLCTLLHGHRSPLPFVTARSAATWRSAFSGFYYFETNKGRLPRPLPVLLSFELGIQRGLAMTNPLSPRGAQRRGGLDT